MNHDGLWMHIGQLVESGRDILTDSFLNKVVIHANDRLRDLCRQRDDLLVPVGDSLLSDSLDLADFEQQLVDRLNRFAVVDLGLGIGRRFCRGDSSNGRRHAGRRGVKLNPKFEHRNVRSPAVVTVEASEGTPW